MLAARIIIEELTRQGITDFCLAPGSRCTPLSLAIANHPLADCLVHFDERALGFYALGLAKAKKKPVAIVVTSGTAVANLMPAVVEAFMDNVPLLLLTADRPTELRDSGANQTIDQVKIFGNYVRYQTDLPCYDKALLPNYLATTIAQSVFRTKNSPSGPVQINCMFREPFFSYQEEHMPTWTSTIYHPTKKKMSASTLREIGESLQKQSKGVIVLANLDPDAPIDLFLDLARKLNWPMIADVLSGARCDDANLIPYFHTLYENEMIHADFILQFGSRTVGRETLGWINSCKPQKYVMVTNHPFRQDPNHHLTDRIDADPVEFVKDLLPFIVKNQNQTDYSSQTNFLSSVLKDFFTGLPSLSEPGIFFSLAQEWRNDMALFIANSMPIRDAERYFFPKYPYGEVFANRAVSGIDGNIATAVGIAKGLKKPVLAIIGDQTALHDLNSLALVRQSLYPVILLVINNYGGGIFSFLSVREKKEHLDTYFANAHALTFENAAKMFSLTYKKLEKEEDLFQAIQQKEPCLLEMTTDREENYILHQKLKETLKDSLLCCTK